MSFKFVNEEKVSFPITNEKDEVIKDYSFNVGSEDFLRKVKESQAVLTELEPKILANDVDAMIQAAKTIIDNVFGNGEFDFLYNAFEKNVFAMIELCKVALDRVHAQNTKRFSKYK